MKAPRVVVIDYESGNLHSVSRALQRAGVNPEVSGDPAALLDADAAVLPGVGSGEAAMRALTQRGLVEPVREFVASGKPFLAICLGLQLLMDRTEEGDVPCLGVIPGNTRRLPQTLKVPHMGWNQVSFRKTHSVLEDIPDNSDFYFVHSYYAEPEDEELVVGVTEYGIRFCSVIARGNLVATQFHPEKSSTLGLRIYENFGAYARMVGTGR